MSSNFIAAMDINFEKIYPKEIYGGKKDNNLNLRKHISLYGKRLCNGGAQFMPHYDDGDNTLMFRDNNEFMQEYLTQFNNAYDQEKRNKINKKIRDTPMQLNSGNNFNNSNIYMNENNFKFNESSFLRENNKSHANLISSTLCENKEKKPSYLVKSLGVENEDIIDITNEFDFVEYKILNDFKNKENSKFENIKKIYEKFLSTKKDINLKEAIKDNTHGIDIVKQDKLSKIEVKGDKRVDSQAEKDINLYTLKLAQVTIYITNNDKKIDYLKEEISKAINRIKRENMDLERENMDLRETLSKMQKEQENRYDTTILENNNSLDLLANNRLMHFQFSASQKNLKDRSTAKNSNKNDNDLERSDYIKMDNLKNLKKRRSQCFMSVKGLDEVSFKEKKVSHRMKGLCKGRLDDIGKTKKEIKKQGLTI